MSEKPARLWRYCPRNGALLWKIMFLEPDLIVCENRLKETNKTFFTCLLLQSGKEVLKDFTLEERVGESGPEYCMTGLETTRGNLFYVHGYQDNSPEHAGIWAVDPIKASVVWARPGAAFVANLEAGMLVYSAGSFAGFPERSYMLLDCMTGEVIDTIGEDTQRANALRRESLSDEEIQKVLLPGVPEPGCSIPGLSGDGFGEYIEHDGGLVTVIHTPGKGGEGFDATIRGYCKGSMVYEDILAAGTAVPCVNYFLLRGVTLYYIRNMNELISVRL